MKDSVQWICGHSLSNTHTHKIHGEAYTHRKSDDTLCGFSWVMNGAIFQSKPASHHRWCYRNAYTLHTHTYNLTLFLLYTYKKCLKTPSACVTRFPHRSFTCLVMCKHIYMQTQSHCRGNTDMPLKLCRRFCVVSSCKAETQRAEKEPAAPHTGEDTS